MALLLPQCAPPESLHHQLTVRQRLSLRRSRKAARATHGAAESSTNSSNSTKKAATDRYRIPAGTEPCCNITSPLLMTPRISVRRSSRLRVRKGRWDDAKTDTDMDSAEWINRMLDKNGVVEVDPVTIAKQMKQEQLYQMNSPTNTTNSHYHAANYVSSADASHINPPRSSGFPSNVPLPVALAAGSAVALATVAFMLKSLNKQGDETASTSSDSEGSNLSSSFKDDPVAPDSSSKDSQTPPQGMRGNKEALASTAAAAGAGAGAAILQPGNVKERSSRPSPPSVSKTGSQGEKAQSPTKDASVTPFFTSARSSVADSKPAPPVSRWGEDKFKSVQPFFADEQQSSTTKSESSPSPSKTVTTSKSEKSPSPSKTVAPFFTPSKSSVSDTKPAPPVSRWGEDKFKAVQPFFTDEQQSSTKKSDSSPSSSKTVTTSKSEKSPSPSKTVTTSKSEKSPSPSKTVTPFFTSAKSSVSDTKPAPPVSRWGEDKFKAIQPFFADDRAAVAPSIPEKQSTTKKSEKSPSPSKTVTPLKSEKSPSPSKTVTPFFTSHSSSVADSKPAPPASRWGEDKFKAVQPFFADEQQSSTKKIESSPSPSKAVTPAKSESSPSTSKTVTPFFPSAKSTVADSKPAPPVSRWGEDKFKSVQPFFGDEQQSSTKKSESGPSPSKISTPAKSESSPSPSKTVTALKSEKSPSPSKTVTPFFTSAKSSMSDSKPAPPASRWGEDKFKTIQPFFADDRADVAPSIPEEQSTSKQSEKSPSPSKTITPLKSEKSPSPSKAVTPLKSKSSPSPSKTVTPFFTSAKSSVSDLKPAPPVSRWGEDKFKAIQPFFADDRADVAPSIPEEQSTSKQSEKSPSPSKTITPLKSEKSPSPSKAVTPLKSEKSPSPSKAVTPLKSKSSPSPSKTVTPFFTSAKSSVSDLKPAPPVSRWGEDKFKAIQPFFADDRAVVAPSIPEEQSTSKQSKKSPSPSKTITPSKSEKSPSPSKAVTPLKSESSPSPSKTVTPFFTSAKSSVSDTKPAPPASRWGEDKFQTVQPFFADEQQSSTKKIESSPSTSKAVTPLKSESSPSPSKTVTPFFTSAKSSVSDSKPAPPVSRWEEDKFKAIQPFFADEQQSSTKKSEKSPSPSKTGTPSKSKSSPSPSKTVTPFFTSARSSGSDSKPAPPVSRWGEDKFKTIQPFFADDRAAVAPSIPEEQSSTKKSEKSPSPSKTVTPAKSESSPSPSKTVTPFFTSAKSSGSDSKPAPPVSRWGEDKFKTIQPFFADDRAAVAPVIPEEQSTAKKSESSSSASKTVTPFFGDEQQGSEDAKESVSVESVPPFSAVNEQQSSSNGPSLKTVTPFFADEQQQTNGSSLENVIPFFADEQQQAPGVSQSKRTLDLENVKPFFSDDQVGRPSLAASVESLKPTRIPEDEMAGMPQDQRTEFLKSEEFAVLDDIKAEEERRQAKMKALQAAFPALAIGAGAVGALAGVDGALEMVGVTATASFISYELLWANKRNELLEEISRISDHHQLFRFLQKRKVLKDDC